MSCHFYIMRRRKAALKAAQAAQDAKKGEANTNPIETPKAAQKAPDSPRKASKRKDDAV